MVDPTDPSDVFVWHEYKLTSNTTTDHNRQTHNQKINTWHQPRRMKAMKNNVKIQKRLRGEERMIAELANQGAVPNHGTHPIDLSPKDHASISSICRYA